MKFPPSVLEEIKARLPASAVVGRRVRLAKAGREWKGLSPFNKEKSPSFFVNDTKQAWFDFSSGRNGDIFKFVMETEGLSFPEAVERLAAEAGVVLPRMTEEAERHENVRKGLHDAMELAAAWFESCLHGEGGGAARRYLAGRGLDGQIAHEFRLGYAPNQRFALRDHLAAKGVSAEVMAEAGLLIHGEDIAVPYDRFRDRVMFPIWDQKGRVVAFGGRAMSADQPAKYLNSPETPLFHKGHLLYNHHRARKAAHDKGQAAGSVIAVEGYVDVIAMHRVGFPQTVAPLGTALTEDQIALMWRMADEPILCFDGDGAGRRAAFRAIDVALPKLEPGKSLRFAFLPDGQDPDDLSRSGGASAIQSVIAAARPLVDVVWAREIETMPVDTPERRAAFERRLREVLGQIRDESIRRHYQDEVGERLRQLFNRGQQQPRPRGRQPGQRQGGFGGDRKFGERGRMPPEPMVASPSLARSRLYLSKDLSRSGESPREAFILLGLAANAGMLAELGEEIVELDFGGREALRFGQMLLDVVASGEITQEALARRQSSAHIAAAREALSAAIRPGDARRLIQDADPTQLSDSIRQAILLHRRARTLHSDLKAAEAALAEDMSEANFAWVRDIKARLESLDGTEADPDDVS